MDLKMEEEPLLPRKTHEKKQSNFWKGKDGALGWTVAAAIMLINFITIGLGRMSGILYVDFMKVFKVNRKLASAPFSVQQSTRNLFGPLVGVLGHRFGIRSVTIVGGLLGAGSAAVCAFAEDITWITVFWGGVYGVGIAFSSTLSQVVLDDYFERNLSSASGLAFSGGSVGAMVFSFVLQTAIDIYGLENTFFIMGGIILLVVPLSITLTSPPWPKEQTISNGGGSLTYQNNLNPRLRKSLATEDLFPSEKGIDKNLDKMQSLGEDLNSAEKGISQNVDGSQRCYVNKKNSKFTYGTLDKNKVDAIARIEKDMDQMFSPPNVASLQQKSNDDGIGIEKENIDNLMPSIENLYSDSKTRISKFSQDLNGAEIYVQNSEGEKTNAKKEFPAAGVSEKEFLINNQDVVDYRVVNNLSGSDQNFSKDAPLSYKVDSKNKSSKARGINKPFQVNSGKFILTLHEEKPKIDITSKLPEETTSKKYKKKDVPSKQFNCQTTETFGEKCAVDNTIIQRNLSTIGNECSSVATAEVDKKARKLSGNASSPSDPSYKLLYLRNTFQDDFPKLSFPKKVADTIFNLSETDSVKKLEGILNDEKLRTGNNDLQSLINENMSPNTLLSKGEKSGIPTNIQLSLNAQIMPSANNNSFDFDQSEKAVQGDKIQLSPEVEHQSSSISEDVTVKKNLQLLEDQTKNKLFEMYSTNNASKVDHLFVSNQDPDIDFLRRNTSFIVQILMLNTNKKISYLELLFKKQLGFLLYLVEKEKRRDSSEKYALRNKIKKVEQGKFSMTETKELDSKLMEEIFETEQINMFLDDLFCVFQRNEGDLLSHFNKKHRVHLEKIIAELKKLFTFASTYKRKIKKRGNSSEAESSTSSDREINPTEKSFRRNKRKSSRLKRQKSTPSIHGSVPQKNSPWDQQSLPSRLPSSEQWHSPSEDESRDGCCSIPSQIRVVLKLYLNPAFLVICLCRAVHLLTFMGVLTVIVDYSMDRGLLESDGKYAVTAMSLGDLIGRLCTGWVTDCRFIGLERFMLIAMVLIGIASVSFPFVPPSTILLLACAYSILQGSVFIRHPVLVSKYTRLEERTVGMGFMTLFSGLLGFLMPLYIGHFRDGVGSYNQVFYINGSVCAGIGLLWVFEPWLKKYVR